MLLYVIRTLILQGGSEKGVFMAVQKKRKRKVTLYIDEDLWMDFTHHCLSKDKKLRTASPTIEKLIRNYLKDVGELQY
jgi:hypothetical protein